MEDSKTRRFDVMAIAREVAISSELTLATKVIVLESFRTMAIKSNTSGINVLFDSMLEGAREISEASDAVDLSAEGLLDMLLRNSVDVETGGVESPEVSMEPEEIKGTVDENKPDYPW